MTSEPVEFLLVDDLEENLLALAALLRRDGLNLLMARSGADALELLLRHDVALAIVDVQMPGMNGFELAELMRGTERTRRVPIMFLTAGAIDRQRRFRGYEAGAVDFLFKPVEPDVLRSKADVFFELHRQRLEVARQRDELRAAAKENARLLAESRRHVDALRQANSAKDHFLAVLSHELRTPLAPVLATAQALESDASLGPEQQEMARLIRRNVELEARLIDDLLDVTRITHNKLEIQTSAVDLHEKVRHVLQMCEEEIAAKQLVVTTRLEAGRHVIQGDPTRLQQVVWNLLKNAVKFSDRGGVITVETSDGDAEQVRLRVTDRGVGIEPESLGKIFDAFEQGSREVTRQFGGLGLGLAITKALVAMHDGTIEASSAGRGSGATFTIRLPVVRQGLPPAPPPPPPGPDAASLQCTVLLVEDHEDTRRAMVRLLGKFGCTVTAAASAGEALRLAEASAFGVVISDVGLPDGTGTELMRQLKARYGMKGIALSGYGMDEDIARSREAGFLVHLTKPVDTDALKRAVRDVTRSADVKG